MFQIIPKIISKLKKRNPKLNLPILRKSNFKRDTKYINRNQLNLLIHFQILPIRIILVIGLEFNIMLEKAFENLEILVKPLIAKPINHLGQIMLLHLQNIEVVLLIDLYMQ